MFGKIPGVNAKVIQNYKSVAKPNVSIHTGDMVVLESNQKHEKEVSQMNQIIHKLQFGLEISYEEYSYVLSFDSKMAELIQQYREFRSNIRKELFSLNEEEAVVYYKELRKNYKAGWLDDEWKTYYMKAVDAVWYEYLKMKEKTRVNCRI